MSTPIVDRIRRWKVHNHHKIISYELDFDKEPPRVYKIIKKLIGLISKACYHKKTWEDPHKFWSKQTIELEAKKLVKDIIQALDRVCPEKDHVTKKRPPSWWTTEVHNLRKKLRVAEN